MVRVVADGEPVVSHVGAQQVCAGLDVQCCCQVAWCILHRSPTPHMILLTLTLNRIACRQKQAGPEPAHQQRQLDRGSGNVEGGNELQACHGCVLGWKGGRATLWWVGGAVMDVLWEVVGRRGAAPQCPPELNKFLVPCPLQASCRDLPSL